MIPIDMVPLYMMIGGSLAMLVFTIAYKSVEENTMRRRRGLRCWPTMGW